MASEYEIMARILDDDSVSVPKSARHISKLLGNSRGTCANWIQAKRAGYSSAQAYLDHAVKKRGYKGLSDYTYRRAKAEKLSEDVSGELEEDFLTLMSKEDLDEHEAPNKLGIKPEIRARLLEMVDIALGVLSKRERYIIQQRYLVPEPKILEAIGEELKISRSRITQLEHSRLYRVCRRMRTLFTDGVIQGEHYEALMETELGEYIFAGKPWRYPDIFKRRRVN